jgi:tetratricopeptide (TPR) repeat protein/tRNA A-37 threonylcarbamoyl transferase component Bud32
MISQNEHSKADEELLDKVIAEYLQAESTGNVGGPQDWLARYPACAAGLAEFFTDRQRLNRLVRPGRVQWSIDEEESGSTRLFSPVASSGSLNTVNLAAELPLLSRSRYRPVSFHARGGMGEIWLGEDESIGRKVAIKKLRSGRESQVGRFLVEAQITGQLEHPSVVPLHDMGVDDGGHPFYIMKFIKGQRLKDAIAAFHDSKPSADWPNDVGFRRLLETFVSICNVVAYAHSKGVLHRDIKPDNVMLGSYGETMVVDWGLAKVIGQSDAPVESNVRLSGVSSTATQDGAVVGSPFYMPPEGAEGRPDAVDQSSDVYLLGATLYETLTAKPPRVGSSSLELIDLARYSRPTNPRKIDPKIPCALEAICLKAMAFNKADRYETPLAVANDVERFLAGAPTDAYREPWRARVGRWVRRHRRAILANITVLAVVLLSGFALQSYRRAGVLAEREHARGQLAEFDRLADEAQFFAANTDSIGEKIPYYDPARAKTAGDAALALAAPWGEMAEGLPLPDEREQFLRKQYALRLQLAQVNLQGNRGPTSVEESLTLLNRAQAIGQPTRAYYRLRSQCLSLLGDIEAAKHEAERADGIDVLVTAQDEFLFGEHLRLQDAGYGARRIVADDLNVAREHLNKAIQAYRHALDLDPKHFWARLQLGRCLIAADRGPEAIAVLGACIAIRPLSPWAHTTRGLANAMAGRFEEALHDLDTAVGLDPNFEPARLNRGIVHWLQRDIDGAMADFEAVLAAPPARRLVEARFYRGQLLLDQQRDREALADFSNVIDARPSFSFAYWFRAKAQFRLGLYDEGQASLARLLALGNEKSQFESLAKSHVMVGRALRNLAQQELDGEARRQALFRAANQLQAAMTADAPTSEACQHLGAVRELLGATDDAIASYSQGLTLTRDSIILHRMRGWLYANNRQYDLAKADFAEAVRIAPADPEAHAGLGFALAELGHHDDARKEATAALLGGSESQLVLHNVACVYGRLSELESKRKTEYENLALVTLDRALYLAHKNSLGHDADERALIKKEQAFPVSLRSRPEFERLLSIQKR